MASRSSGRLPRLGLKGSGAEQEIEDGPELPFAEFFGPGALSAPDLEFDAEARTSGVSAGNGPEERRGPFWGARCRIRAGRG
jgi:hypothetical protein